MEVSEILSIIVFYHYSGYKCFQYYYEQQVQTELTSQLDSAIVYENRVYARLRKQLSDDHPHLKIIANNFAVFYPQRAIQRRNAWHFEGAIEDYERALEFSNEKGELYSELGLTHYYAGSYAQAIENYERSYQLDGVSEAVYLNITGMAYAKLGELTEAQVRFTELQEILPDHGLPYRDWGLYYALKGEPDNALENLKKAIELGYDNWEWLRTEEALAPLRDNPRFQALMEQAPAENE